MTPSGTKPPSSAKRAVTELRRLIFSGELPAGSDHLESELAVRLGMSRTPVREASLMLESQGLVEVRPRKGVRILPISPEDMREIYDILTALESLAAERAAARGYSEAELRPLSRSISEMDAALEAGDLELWAAADERFHAELMRLGGNTRAAAMVAMMSDQVRRARMVTLFMRPLPTQSNDDHRAVLAAIRDGDSTAARDLHRAHREAAKSMLVDLLRTHRLKRV